MSVGCTGDLNSSFFIFVRAMSRLFAWHHEKFNYYKISSLKALRSSSRPHKPNGFCAVCCLPPNFSSLWPCPPAPAPAPLPVALPRASPTGLVRPPTVLVTGEVTVFTVLPTGLRVFSAMSPTGSRRPDRRPRPRN